MSGVVAEALARGECTGIPEKAVEVGEGQAGSGIIAAEVGQVGDGWTFLLLVQLTDPFGRIPHLIY